MNKFGKTFSYTTFGESHGSHIGCVIDGVPPKIELGEEYIQSFLDKRKPGGRIGATGRNEADQVKIVSGVFQGLTTGAPLALLIENQDARSDDYSRIKDKFRPSHADFAYFAKYGHRDYRGGGRASARETAMRVAAGAVARKIIPDIKITAFLRRIGSHEIKDFDAREIGSNELFCPDAATAEVWRERLAEAAAKGDSLGAVVEVWADNVPIGLGEPLYDRLDADLSAAMIGINAAKAVAIGDGFEMADMLGSEAADEMYHDPSAPFGIGFRANHSGGIIGGISTGQRIRVRVAFKPTPSIAIPKATVDMAGAETTIKTEGRHDVCVGIRAVPVVEAMMAGVLADHFLIRKAYL